MTSDATGPARPPIVVLDPGLKDGRSHHHVINRHLALRAAAEKVHLTVVANRGAAAADFSYQVSPFFSRGIYEDSAKLGDREFAALVADHSRDLAACLQAAGPTRLVVHTATAAFLQALAAGLSIAGSRVTAAVVQLMFHPLSLARGVTDGAVSNARYRVALERLRCAAAQHGTRLDISTSCVEFADVFAGLGAGPVGIHPYALLSRADRDAWMHRDRTEFRAEPDRRRRAFLYGGDLKLDKGLPWVAAALPRILRALPDIECVVHLGDDRFANARLALMRQQIIDMATAHSNLHLIVGHAPPATWDETIASADVLLIPYDPASYRWKTSGLFWEFLLKRREDAMIVMTRDTWMEREAIRSGIDAAVVAYGDTDALLPLLQRAQGRLPAAWPEIAAFGEGNDDFIFHRLC